VGTYATSERTRQALITAAGELIAEYGVGRVSTRGIAQKANENLGAIHYHFGGKDGLRLAVVRFACQPYLGPTVPELLKPFDEHLNTVPGQTAAVRAVVRHFVQATLASGRPRWCSRVLFEALQHAGLLRDELTQHMIGPMDAALARLVHAVRPEWTSDQTWLWIHLTLGPVIYHADHVEIILEHLGTPAYTDDYLARLEQRVAADALRTLGLPADEELTQY